MRINSIILTLLLVTATTASAQSRYDDDIYYNASKDTKTKQENAAYKKAQAERKAREAEQQRLAEQEAFNRLYQAYYGNYEPERGGEPYEAAGDQTIVSGGSDRDVDEYNRRGKYAPDNRQISDTTVTPEDFQYTRRIERFHNSDVIAENNDQDLVNYYYSSQQPEINVYYINNDPYSWNNWGWAGWSPYYSYYSPYWGWNNWGWNSYWSWNWGWGTSWNWSWGYPGWGYPTWGYPGFGWGWTWGGYPGWNAPVNNYIASRYTPNGRRPSGIRNGYTGIPQQQQHGHLSGNMPSSSHSNRYTLTPGQAGNYRPNTSGNYRPGQSSVNSGRDNSNHNTYTPSQTSGNRNGNRSYNNNSTSRNNYNNSGSFNSGSRGSWGSGGSSSSGSSHRGGRR